MLYLVLNITNTGCGYVLGGCYRSLARAEKRLAYCEKVMNDKDVDSWRIEVVDSPNITAPIPDYY